MQVNLKDLLERADKNTYAALEVGEFRLSIQASYSHYCSPRETLDNANDYSAFEIAVFDKESWVNPSIDERFSELHGLLVDQYEVGSCPIGAFIPSETVQKLYDHCLQLEEGEPA